MNNRIMELIISATLGGLITGVVAPTLGEWLRGFFNSHHTNNRKKKHKEKIIDVLRYHVPEITEMGVNFDRINFEVFKGKRKDYTLELLMELYREGRVDKYELKSNDIVLPLWAYRQAHTIKRIVE
ncbi:hypothetical protein [Cohnella abietis]|uniref:Uncharacterized protein n=1 Tax=Cohnella abietis TaxID=2507935 RepID=A0A3T1D7P9_9BACL|nr:hypothetical protein [Cohnella abietis]BBI34079.1 hypothetical protein KCTCHS21_34780 [Cohnella abietis]